MKLAYRKMNEGDFKSESGLKQVMELEKQGRLDEAEKVYKGIIRANPHDEKAYDRLMIIYRKQKDPGSELQLIESAIKVFKAWFEKKSPFTRSKKIGQLSSTISRITGLTSRKTDLLFTREPLARWLRRKNLLIAKIPKKLK